MQISLKDLVLIIHVGVMVIQDSIHILLSMPYMIFSSLDISKHLCHIRINIERAPTKHLWLFAQFPVSKSAIYNHRLQQRHIQSRTWQFLSAKQCTLHSVLYIHMSCIISLFEFQTKLRVPISWQWTYQFTAKLQHNKSLELNLDIRMHQVVLPTNCRANPTRIFCLVRLLKYVCGTTHTTAIDVRHRSSKQEKPPRRKIFPYLCKVSQEHQLQKMPYLHRKMS